MVTLLVAFKIVSMSEVFLIQNLVIEFILMEKEIVTNIHIYLQKIYRYLTVDKRNASCWVMRLSSSEKKRTLPRFSRIRTIATS